ncbi:MAG: DUF1802 family protein, partial [SAR202 cluster bacterium]|nr:DUF1802 family protein [SAR202 cluster bacterium]
MLPESTQVALKEWAVACSALDQGRQVILLRKGGIHEDGLDFRVIHDQFVLYPSYEHQKPGLVKPEWQAELAATFANAPPSTEIRFTHFAKVTSLVEIMEQERLDRLDALHLWTAGYAQQRLHWKPRRPLTVMFIRAYRIRPVTVPFLGEYAGCTSWVPLAQGVPLDGLVPVLTDEDYQRQADQVMRALDAGA